MFWPILKAQSLASVPGMAGTVVAINSLFGLLPFRVVYGFLADTIGLTRSMLYVTMPVFLLMFLFVYRLPAVKEPIKMTKG